MKLLPTADEFIRPKHKEAVAIRDQCMARLGFTDDIFFRPTMHNGDYAEISRTPSRSAARAKLWAAMREHPSRPTYPVIAQVCGIHAHSSVYAAVKKIFWLADRQKKANVPAGAAPIGVVKSQGDKRQQASQPDTKKSVA
ncbi:MAG: hypothetical protein KF805_12570 [Phycisphaeraceae bacterium]|nr:hypothetical protein [Phycisphaeraceae bacterium]